MFKNFKKSITLLAIACLFSSTVCYMNVETLYAASSKKSSNKTSSKKNSSKKNNNKTDKSIIVKGNASLENAIKSAARQVVWDLFRNKSIDIEQMIENAILETVQDQKKL